MRVNRFEVCRHIRGRYHGVAQAVNRHHCRRSLDILGCWRSQFGPEGLEDGPSDVWVADAEVGETVEGDVGLEGEGQGMLLRYLKFGEDGTVGAGDLGEEVGGVGFLDVLSWFGVGEGPVFGVADCEIHGFDRRLVFILEE